MNLQQFKHDDWTKIYEGRWSFLTSTHFVDQYTKEIKFGRRPFIKSQSIIFVSRGFSHGWMRQEDRDSLGHYLSKEIENNPKLAKEISAKLKFQTKEILKFIAKNENTVATIKLYKEFWRRILAYYQPHMNVKYVVDYLQPGLLKKYLPDLESARLAAETVFDRTEDFTLGFVKILSKETKYRSELLLCLTKEELTEYFKTKKLPSKAELGKRNQRSVIFGDKTSYKFFSGIAVGQIEKLTAQAKGGAEIKGTTAFPGKVTGIVRIVKDPKKSNDFKKGEILVTGSTRPEFLPIMHKAAAFVTDAGGILSHAAITAREMEKPCVIGTKNGTKLLRTGDLVEVDAGNGIIKKLRS